MSARLNRSGELISVPIAPAGDEAGIDENYYRAVPRGSLAERLLILLIKR
jgi:hypothetical protein